MQHHESSHERKTKKLLAFCVVEKAKLRMIEDIFTENTGLGSLESARSVYLALCEIASDFERNDNLEISQEAIARRTGLARSTVQRILPVFARLGLIRIKGNAINGMRARSTYTLVRGELPLSVKRTALTEVTENGSDSKKEYSEETFERPVSKTNTLASNTGDSSLADGSTFNPETGEHEW